ncbi:MAG: VPS10 domain-containing protein [Candidatus Cryosericum sp.]
MLTISHRLRTACGVFLVILIGLSLPCAPKSVRAGSSIAGYWEQIPPIGGVVESLAIDPSNSAKVYAGTSSAIFRSTDHGLNWKAASEGLPLEGFRSLVIDPTDPSKLFVGTSGSGLFYSTDGGTTWAKASSGLTDKTTVNCLAIDPLHPSILYAGTDDGIFRSTDGGAHWASPSSALIGEVISCLAIDPVTVSTLYAGTSDGAFVSSDDGTTWIKASTGLTDLSVQSITIDPVTTSTLYAGTKNGVFRSANRGTTWISASSGLADKNVECLTIEPVTTSTLYAGTTSGVSRSTDGGSSWAQPSTVLSGVDVLTLAIDPTAPSTLYAGTNGRGLLKSSDHAGSWTWSQEGLYVYGVTALATHPDLPHALFVGTFSEMFITMDDGTSWYALPGVPFIQDIVFDSTTPSKVYAVSWLGVARSTDSGGTWSIASSSDLLMSCCLAIDPVTRSILYVGGADKGGILRSTDSGATWAKWSTGLTDVIRDLAIDPVTGSTFYATTDRGLLRSTDRGTSWKVVSTEAAIGAIAIDPKTPSTVYAAGSLGIYRSTDGGDTWKLCSGAGMILKPTAVAVDPVTMSTVYAGAAGAMFCSTDAGDSWMAMSMTGLPPSKVNSISIVSGTPTTLFACTDRGLFRWSAASPPSVPDGFIDLITTTTVTLTWPASTAGTSPIGGYAIYRSTTAGSTGDTPIATVAAKETIWTDTTCQQGVTYYYTVAAFDSQTPPLYSAKSSEVSETLMQPSPPSVPGGLTATSSVTDIRLRWSASTAGSSLLGGYAVYRSTTAGSPGSTPIATVGATVTSWTDTSCQQGTTYYYAVAAFGSEASPLYSGKPTEASAKLLVPPPVVLTLTLQLGNTRMQVRGSDGTSETVTLDAAPVLGAGNRTLVPVRAVAEAMGGTVGWDPVTRTASVTVGSNTLELTLGKNTALFNGTATPIDTDPKVLPLIINGRTMLPLRFVVESLGAEVSYDQATKTITITYTKT